MTTYIKVVLHLLWLIPLMVFLMGVTEINIGINNQVNTNTVTYGDCLKGNGVTKKVERKIQPFDKVVVNGVFDINVECGAKPKLEVTADENLHSLIATEVKNGVLYLSSSGSFCTDNPLRIDVQADKVSSFSAQSGSESVVNCSNVKLDGLDVALSGTSSLEMNAKTDLFKVKVTDSASFKGTDFAAKHVDATVNGTSTVEMNGKADVLKVRVTDTASFMGADFVTENVDVTASGATEAQVHATSKLTGTSRDASSVSYLGKPRVVDTREQDVGEFVEL